MNGSPGCIPGASGDESGTRYLSPLTCDGRQAARRTGKRVGIRLIN